MTDEVTNHGERTPGQVPSVGATPTTQVEVKPEFPDFQKLISEAVANATAELSKTIDARLPKPPEEDSPEARLEQARERIAELEGKVRESAFESAVRNHAEEAGVRVNAALQAVATRKALEGVDLADGKAVTEALKKLADNPAMDFLRVTTHARVPKATAETPAPRKSGVSREQLKTMTLAQRLEFRNSNPEVYKALMES